MQDQELVLKLAQTLYNRKASDIAVLKVGHLTVLCDYMVIASGRSAAQVSALSEDVDELMAKDGVRLEPDTVYYRCKDGDTSKKSR